MATWLKISAEWPTTGDLYKVEEDFRCQSSIYGLVRDLSMTSTWESMTTIHQWRVKGPLELDTSGDWRYQTAVCSQILEGLLERFDRLSLESLEQVKWTRVKWTRVIVSQPTLRFPP